jgi:hypothetical protein
MQKTLIVAFRICAITLACNVFVESAYTTDLFSDMHSFLPLNMLYITGISSLLMFGLCWAILHLSVVFNKQGVNTLGIVMLSCMTMAAIKSIVVTQAFWMETDEAQIFFVISMLSPIVGVVFQSRSILNITAA